MDRLASLNPAQREAASTLAGPLLVLAGAGTGKTRVITYRMAELIARGVNPASILSVTFTNKAAKEMQQRTSALLGRRMKQRPTISTFHSLCVKILRKEIGELGYPEKFAIYDRGDQESAARTALREIRVGDAAIRPGDLLNRISRWKSAGVPPDEATDFVENDQDFLCAVAYRRYQNNLRASGAVDFDDLLLLTKQLFREHPDVLERQQSRYGYVQIDEYQDTNGLQFELIQALVKHHQNLCVVGDDDQSIYGWRGAEVTHILNFQAHFPTAKVVRLQDNYRCTDKIIELANRLVKHNQGRHDKVLVAHKRAADDIRFLGFEDETKEAETIVREIRDAVKNENAHPKDFAILFRTNEQPRVFESELRRVQLPYKLVGGQSFFDRREIRDLMAYLKTLAFPKDEVSLLRIINVPSRGIGNATVEKLLKRAVREKVGFWEVLPAAVAAGEISTKARTALEQFQALIGRYRHRMQQQPDKLSELLTDLVKEVDYESEICRQYKDEQQQLTRMNVIEHLASSLDQYTERTEKPSLFGFLEESALIDRAEEKDDEHNNAVTLMTLHSAKGLEFPRVYLVGLEEGLLPHHRSLESTEAAIAEERRLAYVGITRAMDELTITRALQRAKWGKKRPSIPSRFLFEMSERFTVEEEEDEDNESVITRDAG